MPVSAYSNKCHISWKQEWICSQHVICGFCHTLPYVRDVGQEHVTRRREAEAIEERGGMTAAEEDPLAAVAMEEDGGKAAAPGKLGPNFGPDD